MKKTFFNIGPYTTALEPQLRQLEKESAQGRYVQLEMIRSSFLSRSVIFENYQPCIAFNEQNQIVGAAVGAKIPLRVNGKDIWAGYGYDGKVSPKYRNQRIAQALGKHTIDTFFIPHQLDFQFVTLKKSNSPVRSLAARVVKNIYFYEFAYLTISTRARVSERAQTGRPQNLSVSLLSHMQGLEQYYSLDESGLGIWWLDKLYQIKITYLHPLIKSGIWIKKRMATQPIECPKEGSVLSSALLFNHTRSNIQEINSILAKLQEKGIQYLLVCCQPGDAIYEYLKNTSINTYGYYLISNQRINKNEAFSLDVRCL